MRYYLWNCSCGESGRMHIRDGEDVLDRIHEIHGHPAGFQHSIDAAPTLSTLGWVAMTSCGCATLVTSWLLFLRLAAWFVHRVCR